MQIPLCLDQLNDRNPDELAGFRLQRFEVLNWGTFDKRPWVMDLQGNMALLTGANGSGKSTLVDALLTLLVANKRRNYNQASSTTSKRERERDEKSYVQGAYGRIRVEESYGSKPKLLRTDGTLTVLLAYFSDRLTKQNLTLAQVLWIEAGAVRKFFAIANAELAIDSHFTSSTRIADLKKHLKASGVEVFDEFAKYSQQFRKRLGLQSEKALDLFNQTVSIKEIGGLNDFVRNHMLEKTDVQTKIRELQESYENLTISHEAIQKARRQLESLVPLTEEAEKYAKLKKEVATLEQFQPIVPAFFASKKLNLLTQELASISQQLTQNEDELKQCDRALEDSRQQRDRLMISISNDSVGQRLQELKRELEQRQKELTSKRSQTKEYDCLAQQLGLLPYADSTTFYAARIKGEKLKQDIDAALQTLVARRDDEIATQRELQKQQTKLEDELKSLRSRKSQIPKTNLDIRDRLVRDLNLTQSDLPFVGELLQVRPEAQEWEGAIERLLRGFGLCVLVPETHYQAVNTYVNQTHLKGRLVYYRVTPVVTSPTQRALNSSQIPHKLEIKQDNDTFSQWLRERLVRQFSYVCCDTVEQFQHETVAITRTGLLKHGAERHEKDDRFSIGDRSQYILGWNNASKIKALETDLKQIDRELMQIDKQLQQLDRDRKQRMQQTSWLQDFMKFVDFSEIDWRTVESDCLQLQEQKQQLEASSNRLKDLEAQLQTTQQEVAQKDRHRDTLIQEIQTLKDRQSNAKREQNQCETKMRSFSEQDIQAFATRWAAKLKEYPMTLATIAKDELTLRDYLQEQLRQREQQQNKSDNSLTTLMVKFKNAFPEVTSELLTSLEYLDEYLKLKIQIEKDDLPRHEKRFKQLMNEKVIIAISMFQSSLLKQEEEIKENINELNESLQNIDYTEFTYIKLCCDPSRNREIRDFKQDLIACLGDAARYSAEDNEERFKNIQARLIERFNSEDRWTNLVTDVRNWLDFSVSECYRSDNVEKEHHTDSSGKSGGQKVKLAYTILASAIAYQFGLNQDTVRHKSFRFVVIDEAFSKSDDSNARYAMALFKNLNLQLLVVTPKDKINVIESYISSLHFVHNASEGNCSKIASIPIEEYRQKC